MSSVLSGVVSAAHAGCWLEQCEAIWRKQAPGCKCLADFKARGCARNSNPQRLAWIEQSYRLQSLGFSTDQGLLAFNAHETLRLLPPYQEATENALQHFIAPSSGIYCARQARVEVTREPSEATQSKLQQATATQQAQQSKLKRDLQHQLKPVSPTYKTCKSDAHQPVSPMNTFSEKAFAIQQLAPLKDSIGGGL